MRTKDIGYKTRDDPPWAISMCLSCPWKECVGCMDSRSKSLRETTLRLSGVEKEVIDRDAS